MEELQAQTFDAHWQDEKWHEVLCLIAGQLQPQFAGHLIESLLIKKHHFLDYIRLFLAAECFNEVRNRALISSLDVRLLEALKQLIRIPRTRGATFTVEEDLLYLNSASTTIVIIASVWANESTTFYWLQERATKDEDEEVRYQTVVEMARGWHDEPTTLPLLQEIASKDDAPRVRSVAVQMLARGWHDAPITLPFLQEIATKNENGAVRLLAMVELARGWHDDLFVQELLADFKKKSPEVYMALSASRSDFLTGGGHLPVGTGDLRRYCKSATTDANEYVRSAAVAELARGWHDDPAVQKFLAELKEKEPDLFR